MKFIYTSDLHGEIHLYQELLELAISSSSEIIGLGGDLLPSFPPTKRYEDMVPNQKIFIDQFLFPFFKRILETTSVKQIFLIPGNWDLGYPYLFKKPTGRDHRSQSEEIINLRMDMNSLDTLLSLRPLFGQRIMRRWMIQNAPWPPQKNPSYIRSSEYGDQLTPIDPYFYLKGRGTIQEDLDRLPKPLNYKKAIYIMHSPPFGTKLDLIQGAKPAGSCSIKVFIEEALHPLLLERREYPQAVPVIEERALVSGGQRRSHASGSYTLPPWCLCTRPMALDAPPLSPSTLPASSKSGNTSGRAMPLALPTM